MHRGIQRVPSLLTITLCVTFSGNLLFYLSDRRHCRHSSVRFNGIRHNAISPIERRALEKCITYAFMHMHYDASIRQLTPALKLRVAYDIGFIE